MKSQKQPRHRQQQYIQKVADSFRLDEFKTFFRVSRQSVEHLLLHIRQVCVEKNIVGITERVDSGGSPKKTLQERILVMLWFLASLDKYAAIADRFGYSESTACDAVRSLLLFCADELLDKLITWPSQHKQQECSEIHMDSKNFPGVIGMIDGTHIAIRRPSERGIDYYNRKEFYSVVLQAVCTDDLKFTDVYTGYPGKVHDARVFRLSPLFNRGAAICDTNHILGDSAYPNLPWLLTPFRDNGALTPTQRRYNYKHASIRSCIERAFGLLKGRFTRLQKIDQRDIITIVSTILTSCIVHNICILNQDDFVDVLEEDVIPQDNANQHNFDNDAQAEALEKRLNIARRL